MLLLSVEFLLRVVVIGICFCIGLGLGFWFLDWWTTRKKNIALAKEYKAKFKSLHDNDKHLWPTISDKEAVNMLIHLLNPDKTVILNYPASHDNEVAEFICYLIARIEQNPSAWKKFQV